MSFRPHVLVNGQRIFQKLFNWQFLRVQSVILRRSGACLTTNSTILCGNKRDNRLAVTPDVGETECRTRFAPSPTGYLHLGSLRTALFNYLYAKGNAYKEGQFIIRIEDTDQQRTVNDAETRLLDELRWAKLTWDEGPDIGGPYGPYRQSERAKHGIYTPYALRLLRQGQAYRCFCSTQRLQQVSETLSNAGLANVRYDRYCYHRFTQREADNLADAGKPHVIRFLCRDSGYPAFQDSVYGSVRGEISTSATLASALSGYDDPVLVKSNQLPTYHLANVIDDHLMRISHVIRGAEWLSSTPLHVALYDAFSWKPPVFAHVSLLVDENGAKLSKRNHTIDISMYRNAFEILPEALLNFIVLLGWSHQSERSEFMTLKDMKHRFTSLKFTKGNTKVNFNKLTYLQSRHAANIMANGEPAQVNGLINRIVSVVRSKYTDTLSHAVRPVGFANLESYVERILHLDAGNFQTAEQFVNRNVIFFDSISYPPIFEGLGDAKSVDSSSLPNLFTKDELINAAQYIVSTCFTTEHSTSLCINDTIRLIIKRKIKLLPRELITGQNTTPDNNLVQPVIKFNSRTLSQQLYSFLRGIFLGGKTHVPITDAMILLGGEFCATRLRQFSR